MMAALAEAQREARCVRAAHAAEAPRWERLEAEGRRTAAAERRLQAEVDAMAQHEARMQAHLLELEAELALRAGLRPDAAAEGSTWSFSLCSDQNPSSPPPHPRSTPPSKHEEVRRAAPVRFGEARG